MATTNGHASTTSSITTTEDASLMYGKAYAGSLRASSTTYKPLDERRYLSPYGARREPSALRQLVPIMAIPGMISLGGGMPNPHLFPFESVTVRMKDGFEWRITHEDKEEMIDSFQYSGTAGIDPLLVELRRMQQREHNPPLPDNVSSAQHQRTVHRASRPAADKSR